MNKTLIFKQLLENMTEQELVLVNPFVFFLMMFPGLKKQKYLYWYAYSFGKVNNVIWGYYRTNDKKFKIKGICGIYDMKSLNEIIKIKSEQNFVLISQLTEDKITKNINNYLPNKEQIQKNKLNRQDLKIKGLQKEDMDFIKKISEEFLDFISHNLVLTMKSQNKCVAISNCEFRDYPGENSCHIYNYGNLIRQKKDRNNDTYELI